MGVDGAVGASPVRLSRPERGVCHRAGARASRARSLAHDLPSGERLLGDRRRKRAFDRHHHGLLPAGGFDDLHPIRFGRSWAPTPSAPEGSTPTTSKSQIALGPTGTTRSSRPPRPPTASAAPPARVPSRSTTRASASDCSGSPPAQRPTPDGNLFAALRHDLDFNVVYAPGWSSAELQALVAWRPVQPAPRRSAARLGDEVDLLSVDR
jgi:hypothetical protein